MPLVSSRRAPLARASACAALAGVLVAAPVAAADPVSTGPSSSASPYVVPLAPGVMTRSILTVGDAVDGYRLVGIPDGMGALEDGGQFRLFVNHELRPDRGIGRAHGGTGGAFVSEWEIKANTLRVASGQDLIDTVWFWNGTGYETRSGARPTSTGSAPETFPGSRRSGIRAAGPATTAGSS